MKTNALFIIAIAIAISVATLTVPNPILTSILYPNDIPDMHEVRAFYDKFGHSVERTIGDDIQAFLYLDNKASTILTIFTKQYSNDYDSRITCSKDNNAQTISHDDVITFLREYDCFGSKPYHYDSPDMYKMP